MRSMFVLLAALLACFATSGCNKAGDALEQAIATYESGDTLGAVEALEQLRIDHPDSPEVRRAAMLAGRWLLEATEDIEDPERRLEYLTAALTWEPDNSRLWSARCRIELDREAWEALRDCAEQGDAYLPSDRKQQFAERLADHDARQSDAAERQQLLEAGTDGAMRTLLRRYPGSPEAEVAAERLSTASLCADMFRFVEILRLQGDGGPLGWGPRVAAEQDRNGQVTALAHVREQQQAFSDLLESTRKELTEHEVIEGEAPIRDGLLAAYDSMGPSLSGLQRAYARRKYKVEDRIVAVVAFDQKIQRLRFDLRDAREASEASCQALASAREAEASTPE